MPILNRDCSIIKEFFYHSCGACPCSKDDMSLEESIRCFEKQKIIKALSDTGGKKMEAAAKLGISRKVLWKKLKEYNLQ
jgi:DNA-binding NtrC family response regulator